MGFKRSIFFLLIIHIFFLNVFTFVCENINSFITNIKLNQIIKNCTTYIIINCHLTIIFNFRQIFDTVESMLSSFRSVLFLAEFTQSFLLAWHKEKTVLDNQIYGDAYIEYINRRHAVLLAPKGLQTSSSREDRISNDDLSP